MKKIIITPTPYKNKIYTEIIEPINNMKQKKLISAGFALVDKDKKIYCEWGSDQLLIFSNKQAIYDFQEKNEIYKDAEIIPIRMIDYIK